MPDDHGEQEVNVYGDEAREALIEDGEISAEEEAFMEGYDEVEAEEEDASSDAYEKAFTTRRRKKRANADFDDEDLEAVY